MKRKFTHIPSFLAVVMCMIMSLAFVCCSDNDEPGDKNNFTSGKWYLVSYNENRADHGEYLKFTKNKMEWNNRLGGENSTYSYTVNGNQVICTHLSGTGGDITFYVNSCNEGAAVTTSSDDFVRVWSRKAL